MELVIVRHGEASWDAKTDMERQLTERGQSQIQAACQWLEEAQWQADEVWVSPYRRAKQSAAVLNQKWQAPLRRKASLGPDSDLKELETMLATFRGDRLMLVAHNPLLSNAIARWHDGSQQSYWGLQPASMAMLTAEVFSAGTATLQWLRHYPNYDHNGR